MGGPFDNINMFLGKGGNPQQLMQMLASKNPNFNQTMTQLRNMSNGMSPKEFALQLGKQSGVSEQEIMEMARKLGAK